MIRIQIIIFRTFSNGSNEWWFSVKNFEPDNIQKSGPYTSSSKAWRAAYKYVDGLGGLV